MDKIKNSVGKIFYGMHFYPGVAEYQEMGADPYRIYISDETIRKMNPSFAGCPVFVEHVDEVTSDLQILKQEADGWVVESFFNPADGKHWAKFIIISDEAERAIKKGFRLSNAYVPIALGSGGLWNGVSYDKEITSGAFEHLAIVNNPRYEESVIMTPDEFKQYNEEKSQEIIKLANSKGNSKGESKMKFNLWKKSKVENSLDLEGMMITLTKSGKEKSLEQIINDADDVEMKMNDDMADVGKKVKLHDGSVCNVEELVEKHKKLNEELELLKKKAEEKGEKEEKEVEEPKANDEDDADIKKDEKGLPMKGPKNDEVDPSEIEEEEHHVDLAKELAEGEEKELAKMKKSNHFKELKNAHLQNFDEVAKIELGDDMVARGQKRYGSN